MRQLPTAAVLLISLPVLLLIPSRAVVAETDTAATRPLIARPATTTAGFNVDAYVEYFDGLDLQEAKNLNGWTGGFDLTVPFNAAMQLRLLLPVRTDAKGTIVASGEETDIEGWGGTFDFATLFFEHQLAGTDGRANRFAYYVGFGYRTRVLETDTPDRYNHQGRSLHVGGRFEHRLAHGGALLLDAEYRSYEVSDDLNPDNPNDDRFNLFRVTGAWLGERRGRLTPALELTADVVGDYVAASVVPELMLHTGGVLELKLGVPVGISSDAPEWGTELRGTFSF